MLYYPLLTTLDAIRTHRELTDTTFDHQFDALLLQLLQEASTEFQEAIERTPIPFAQTRTQDWQADDWCPLDEDLLSLTTLTNGDGTEIESTDYLLEPANSYPKRELLAKRSGSVRFTFSGEPSQALSAAGIWGYVPHYPSAWRSLTTLGSALNGSGLTVALASVSGIEIGHYLKVGDEVLGYVSEVDTDAKTATVVERGALGTPAAEHASGGVSVFQQRPDIAGAVRAVTIYKWLHKDEIGGRVTVISGGVVTVQDLDRSVQQTIDRCRRSYFLAV